MNMEHADAERDYVNLLPADADTLHTIALAARIALFPAALLAIIAAFVDRPLEGGLVEAGTVIGALVLAGLAAVGLRSPQPKADFGAAMLTMLLAGGQALQGFGVIATGYTSIAYGLPIVTCLLLLASGCALGATLRLGTPYGDLSSFGLQQRTSPGVGRSMQAGGAPRAAASSPHSATAASREGVATERGPAAGWYPAPDGETARWWDGSAWTEHRYELSQIDSSPASVGE